MIKNNNPQIGKDVIESLTLGMYEDCRFIFREYIQNAADAVDKAVESSILQKGADTIYVDINREEKQIVIYDNATGISEDKVVPILLNIANSSKKRGENKGFRGIGRLGGLGYCSELRFETSYYGEPVKSIMIWNADLLKQIINNRDSNEEAVDVLRKVTKIETQKEDRDFHYFRVVMKNVTNEKLLDVDSVIDYLSMVAPVDIASHFIYRNKINAFMKDNNLSVDTYNIYINNDQIYKPYTSSIYESSNGGKKKTDDILDVEFLLEKDDDGNVIYWGWYSIWEMKGQIKPINKARGIRLRKDNIQIGSEELCKKFFTNSDDQRFLFYYFGEIHAVHKGLIPNSRRDYFSESDECVYFEHLIKQDFSKLKDYCYDASKLRSSSLAISKYNEIKGKIEQKNKGGYTSSKEKENLEKQLEDHKKKGEKAEKQLQSIEKKIETTDSPLKGVLKKLKPQVDKQKEEIKKKNDKNDVSFPSKIKYRTDKPIYSFYNSREKKIIGKIYAAIASAIADENLREALISHIEEDITR